MRQQETDHLQNSGGFRLQCRFDTPIFFAQDGSSELLMTSGRDTTYDQGGDGLSQSTALAWPSRTATNCGFIWCQAFLPVDSQGEQSHCRCSTPLASSQSPVNPHFYLLPHKVHM